MQKSERFQIEHTITTKTDSSFLAHQSYFYRDLTSVIANALSLFPHQKNEKMELLGFNASKYIPGKAMTLKLLGKINLTQIHI